MIKDRKKVEQFLIELSLLSNKYNISLESIEPLSLNDINSKIDDIRYSYITKKYNIVDKTLKIRK